MIEFGNEYEQFDETVSGTEIKGTTVEFGGYNLTAKFWNEDIDINIGIVEAEKIKNKKKVGNISLWDHNYGYHIIEIVVLIMIKIRQLNIESIMEWN